MARRALTGHFRVPDLTEIGLNTTSAGTHALSGHPATVEMQTVAAEIGLDLSQHRATQVDPRMVTEDFLVYAMETHHLDWLRIRQSGSPHRLLGQTGIDDPYGSSLPDYRRTRSAIVAAVQARLPEMITLAG